MIANPSDTDRQAKGLEGWSRISRRCDSVIPVERRRRNQLDLDGTMSGCDGVRRNCSHSVSMMPVSACYDRSSDRGNRLTGKII